MKDFPDKENIQDIYAFVKSLDIEEDYRKILFEVLLSKLLIPVPIHTMTQARTMTETLYIDGNTIRNLLRDRELIKSHADIVLIFAYYLTTNRKQDMFTVGDIKELYGYFRLVEPANISDTILKLRKKGFIKSINRKGNQMSYQITLDGENKVIKMIQEGIKK